MTIEALKANLSHERKILEDMLILNEELKNASTNEEINFFSTAIESLVSRAKIINSSIPFILSAINAQKVEFAPLPKQTVMKPVQTSSGLIRLTKEEKEKFLEELSVEKYILNKIKNAKNKKEEKLPSFYKEPSSYVVLSSRLFSKFSYQAAKSDMAKSLNENLKKSNMYYLPSSYLAMTFFSMLLVFLFSLVVALLSAFVSLSTDPVSYTPVIKMLNMQGLWLRLLKNTGIAILMPFITFLLFLMYPGSQAKSISTKIESELPFAVIHMSSISGSGVEPRKIFEILARSSEYPMISNEMRKIINQVNLYGYDLVTALSNIAKSTSSEKMSGLLNGIATNIVSGGELKAYLDKRAADILLEYKLERKKYSAMAETSMDMYIGALIAAPLIFMVLIVLMNVTGFGFGLKTTTLTTMLIAGIAVLNICFLVFFQIKQPS